MPHTSSSWPVTAGNLVCVGVAKVGWNRWGTAAGGGWSGRSGWLHRVLADGRRCCVLDRLNVRKPMLRHAQPCIGHGKIPEVVADLPTPTVSLALRRAMPVGEGRRSGGRPAAGGADEVVLPRRKRVRRHDVGCCAPKPERVRCRVIIVAAGARRLGVDGKGGDGDVVSGFAGILVGCSVLDWRAEIIKTRWASTCRGR